MASIRTPNPTDTTQILLDLQRSKQRNATLTQQISSGNRILQVGDDPAGTALVADFQTSINQNNQYMSTIDSAANLLTGTESALGTVNTVVTRLLELGQQGLTTVGNPNSRQSISSEVTALGNDLVSLANTQQGGKFLFAGTKTTTMPFSGTVPANATAVPPTAQTVGYKGNSNTINLQTSASTLVTTNIPGDALFYGPGGAGSSTDLFAAVQALNAGLKNNDTDAISAAYDNLQSIHTRINTSMTEVGGRQGGLSDLKTGMADYNASLTTIQSSVQDVDYPQAITSLNQENVSSQAAMQVLAKVNSKNLFDYLA